jgi:glucose/mannose-6-phosphate isomerase
MKELVNSFPQQLREALEISRSATLAPFPGKLSQVIICGLGGSGIGGSIIAELTKKESPVPVYVNKDYSCPAFANAETLFIACSYSGNTEETLATLREAEVKNVKVVAVTSGGKLAEIAREKGYDLILIPAGMPPRACLGYSLGQLFFIFNRYGLISNEYQLEWTRAADLLEREQKWIHQAAEKLTEQIDGTFPIIYAESGFEGLSVRICQQLNENAKMLCSSRVIPEMNHNELVGWREPQPNISVVLIKSGIEYYRNSARIEFVRDVVLQYTDKVFDLEAKGNSALEKTLYLIHLTDIASCLLAEKRGYDASEIDVINQLKGSLRDLA